MGRAADVIKTRRAANDIKTRHAADVRHQDSPCCRRTSSRLAMLPTSPTCSFVVLVVVDEARLLSSHHRWHRLETVGEAAVLGVHFSVILAYLHEWCLRAEQWLNNLNSWTHINQTMVTLWENSTDRLCTTATEATNANFGEDTNCLSLV